MNNNDGGGGNDNFSEFSSKAFINVGNSFIPDEVNISSKTSYSQILEQIDDIIRLTVVNLNKVFDEEMFISLEKMSEKAIIPTEWGIDKKRFDDKDEVERGRNCAKSLYNDDIIRFLKKCADDYKYKDYFKVDEAFLVVDYLEFAISMFKDDYPFFHSFSNKSTITIYGHPFSDFLSENLRNCIESGELNTNTNNGRKPPLKRDIKYLKKIYLSICHNIVKEIFKLLNPFVPEITRQGQLIESLCNYSHGLYIRPYNGGKFNRDFMISFLQCFVDFFKNMNQLNYAFHIRTQETPSKRGGTKRKKQQNRNRKLKTSRK